PWNPPMPKVSLSLATILIVGALATVWLVSRSHLVTENASSDVRSAPVTPQSIPRTSARPFETGDASWYEIQGKTASGEAMDENALTAAHPSLPLGTEVLVENLDNGKSVVVRINDRGPFARSRVIDLSKAAAEKLDMIASGVAHVR